MRILVVGDVHGESGFMREVVSTAVEAGISTILQVGDFGYWPHMKWGEKFLRDVESLAAEADVKVWWIDGNHENHEWLRLKYKHADGFVPISAHCFYLPRGYRWEWAGVRFGALGGAFSVDWRGREIMKSWWPQEVVTAADLAGLGSEPLDVLVTHDCPAGIELPSHWTLRDGDQAKCDAQRALLLDAVTATKPSLVLHGHWHHRHTSQLQLASGTSVRVEGLANDGSGPAAVMILDLDELAVALRLPDPGQHA